MIEFARSLLRLPLAASAFGAQQLFNLASRGGNRKAEGALYSVTTAAQDEFADDPFFFAGFQFGDEAQRAAIDLFFDVLELKVLRPEWLSRSAERVGRRSAAALRDLLPGDNLRLYLDSLRNTLTVIDLVNRASSMLALPPGPIDLRQALAQAHTFGEYAPLWLVEGLGEAYADQNWSTTVPSGGLLALGPGAELPERSLLMMHAGMGLSLARHLIPPLTPVTSKAEIATTLQRFLDLVRANSRLAFEGPAFESLGLVVRTWYQAMVPTIDEALWALDREALDYFWHGVGRAAYFTGLLPGANVFESLRAEAPHELALLNATAGAAWAFSLVNIKQPELVVHLIETDGRRLSANGAFTNGLISALLMANDTLPGDPYTTALWAYRPQCDCCALIETWNRLVARPCRIATETWFPVLRESHRLGEVFRYQDLGRLTEKVEARN
jgi:hypothetical protein